MTGNQNLALSIVVMAPLNIAAAIFLAMIGFEKVMDFLDEHDLGDPDGWA